MFLRNYYNLLTAFLLQRSSEWSGDAPADYSVPVRCRRMNGDYFTPAVGNVGTLYNYNSGSSSGIPSANSLAFLNLTKARFGTQAVDVHILLGQGTTAATYEDYCLEDMIAESNFTYASTGELTPTTFSSPDEYTTSVDITLTNNGSTTYSVSELGLGLYEDSYGLTLIYRDTFTPVTIAPGDTAVITIALTGNVFNYTPY